MMISFFFLLLLLGGGAAMLGLIVFAIVSKKLWVVPVAGVLMVLGLMAFGLIGSLVVGPSHRNVHTGATAVVDGVGGTSHIYGEVGGMSHSEFQGPPNFNVHVSRRPDWSLIMMALILIAFIIGIVVRRGMSPACGHGFRRAWPVVAVILILGVSFPLQSRDEYSVSHTNTRCGVRVSPGSGSSDRSEASDRRSQKTNDGQSRPCSTKLRKQISTPKWNCSTRRAFHSRRRRRCTARSERAGQSSRRCQIRPPCRWQRKIAGKSEKARCQKSLRSIREK